MLIEFFLFVFQPNDQGMISYFSVSSIHMLICIYILAIICLLFCYKINSIPVFKGQDGARAAHFTAALLAEGEDVHMAVN